VRDHARRDAALVEQPERVRMDRQGIAVLCGPLPLVHDLHTDPAALQIQGRGEPDGPGTDDENLRFGVLEHDRLLSQLV
jgi:hypothetical protein